MKLLMTPKIIFTSSLQKKNTINLYLRKKTINMYQVLPMKETKILY